MGDEQVVFLNSKREDMDAREADERKGKRSCSPSSDEMMRQLPRMFLRVLLVEADDCTRQIIAALLRKCGYRVVAVPDGLKAWETLKVKAENIDLILTEVDLPSISGYAFLTLIMEHDICKNIPVIMMSSQDSISMVLKCMLKGAADFLIKPVRKNKLRNLWQHAWRRQTQIAGRIPQGAEPVKQKVETSESNTASSHSSDIASTQVKGESSEKGSDIESSCTPHYLEAERVYLKNSQDPLHLKHESASVWSNRGRHEGCEHLVDKKFTIRSGLKLASQIDADDAKTDFCNETEARAAGSWHDDVKKNDNNTTEVNYSDNELVESSRTAIDLIGRFEDHPIDFDQCSSINDGRDKFNISPLLELSLRQFNINYFKDEGIEVQRLNHSNASAFSRYNGSKVIPSSASVSKYVKPECPAVTASGEISNQPLDKSAVNSLQQVAASATTLNDMTSILTIQHGNSEASTSGSTPGLLPAIGSFKSFFADHGQKVQPMFQPIWKPNSAGPKEPSSHPLRNSQCYDLEMHNSDRVRHPSSETVQQSPNQTAKEIEKLESEEPVARASPVPTISTSGSLCNGDPSKINKDGNAVANAVDIGASAFGSMNNNLSHQLVHDGSRGVQSHCITQREAALMKFRLKRKDRCYEKKVRYQSRKRLAEQRPRVKGQFVRQVQTEQTAEDPGGYP